MDKRISIAAVCSIVMGASIAHADSDEAALQRAHDAVALWRKSCAGADGPCIQVKRRARPHHCTGTVDEARVTRKRGQGKKAARAVDAALVELGDAELSKLDETLRGRAVEVRAQLRMAVADRDYERTVSIRFPARLDFSPDNATRSERSKKRAMKWLEQMDTLTNATHDAYALVAKDYLVATPVRRISCERAAKIVHWFGTQLQSAEMPKDVRTGPYAVDAQKTYCDQMATQGQTLLDRSAETTKYCSELID